MVVTTARLPRVGAPALLDAADLLDRERVEVLCLTDLAFVVFGAVLVLGGFLLDATTRQAPNRVTVSPRTAGCSSQ